MVPCSSIIPSEVIDHSLPIVKKKFSSGKVMCVPHDTQINTYLGGLEFNNSLSFLNCSEAAENQESPNNCWSGSQAQAWLEEQSPLLQIYTSKKYIDFYLKTDYSYTNMKTLMTVPLHWNEPVHQGLSLIPV